MIGLPESGSVFGGSGIPIGGDGLPDCTANSDVFVGISGIQLISGWDQSCGDQPGSSFYNPFGDQVNIRDLVEDEYGFGPSDNPWNWFIEAGGGDFSACYDDDTAGTGGFNCVEGTTMTAACPLTVWIQVVGECDNCRPFGERGTWFKGSFTMDPFEIGAVCGFGANSVFTTLQPLTNCNDGNIRWGCGPGEQR